MDSKRITQSLTDALDLSETSRKTEKVPDSPEKEVTLQRQNCMLKSNRQSGYFNGITRNQEDVEDVDSVDCITYTGATDKLTIVDGCKIIIDLGTYSTKVGLYTDDAPRRNLPTLSNDIVSCDDAVQTADAEFFLMQFHKDSFEETEKVKKGMTNVLKDIYRLVLRGCLPSRYPVYFTLNQYLCEAVDMVRGCFTELGVEVVEYVPPYEQLMKRMQFTNNTALILDFGSTISLLEVVRGEVADHMEIDNILTTVMEDILTAKGVKCKRWDVMHALHTAFCSENMNQRTVTLSSGVKVSLDDEDLKGLHNALFSDESLLALFIAIIKAAPLTSRRTLMNHIIVVGGFALEAVEEKLLGVLKDNSSQFHVSPRDIKVERLRRCSNAYWEAVRDYVRTH